LSAGIKLSEHDTWWTSSAFFTKLLDDLQAHYHSDEETGRCLVNLSVVGFLSVDIYDPDFGTRLLRMIYSVAKDTLDGTIKTDPLLNFSGNDLVSYYRTSLEELVALLEVDGRYNGRLRTRSGNDT